MKRFALQRLLDWLRYSGRKPMILRGARQVGKTWLVRELSRVANKELFEINFERDVDMRDVFRKNNPKEIVHLLSASLGRTINSANAILFLDEVQSAPWVIPGLRWFYEQMPELPVVAAGSLLEFVLREHDFSMPVGRVTYFRLEPMTYLEFLEAAGYDMLADAIRSGCAAGFLEPVLHGKATDLFRSYCLVGGMPEAVAAFVAGEDDRRRVAIHSDIIASYRDDFNKYRSSVSLEALGAVFKGVPAQLGGRFMYSHTDRSMRSTALAAAFERLSLARVCTPVYHTAATGIPLGAGRRDDIFKAIFLDVGLTQTFLGLGRLDYEDLERTLWANKGALAEQVVGQLLRADANAGVDESLYYWQQIGVGNAEIDYVVQRGAEIVPVEVKAGSSGAMKSLHHFMAKHGLKRAVRFDANPPSRQHVSVQTTQSEPVEYELESYPLYMAELF